MPVVMLQQARRLDGVGHSFRARLLANTRQTLSSKYFDEVCALVAGGLSIKEALRSRPDFPSIPAFEAFLHRNPEFSARLRSVVVKPLAGVDLARDRLDKICELVAAGSIAAEACKAAAVPIHSLWRLLKSDESARGQFDAATKARWSAGAPRGVTTGRRRRWSSEDFDKALNFIRDHHRPNVAQAMGADLPALDSLYRRAAHYPEFAARFYPVMEARAAFIVRHIGLAGDEPSLLLAELQKNETYKAAWRFFKGYDRAERDDLISEFILSVLEGRRSIDDVKKKSIRRELLRVVAGPDRIMTSLNQPVFSRDDEGGGSAVQDTIANDDGIFHY